MENLSSGQKSSFTRLRNQIKDEFETLIAEIREKRDQIEEMRVLLLEDDDDGISIQSEVLNAREEANKKLEEISTLLENTEEKYELITNSHDGLVPSIESIHTDIKGVYDECYALMKSFNQSSELLYGHQNDGLESKLRTLAKDYESSLKTNRTKAEELLLQIEGALTGATNVELAKAFQDQKESYKLPKNGWAILFILTIGFMICLGLDAASISSQGSQYLYDLGKRLMVFGPLIWLALFASKQQAQNKRLEQEYAHKEAVTKTFVGHQRQIEKLAESDEKDSLLVQLAQTTINTIDFNPSSTLEKSNPKKDLPASELLDLAKKAVDKVGK
ncbi:hypothetical protein [Vibrio sp. E14]|uniref:hypothetical protein n=1 Tax=Vibrio sp. E14 TaxID=2849869 RepID=UPI001CF8C549|nr:hypothetical protein [Vibrio sp. E14]